MVGSCERKGVKTARCQILTVINKNISSLISVQFPFKQTKPEQIIGVSFPLNDTVIKIARAFNARRNTRFLEEYCECEAISGPAGVCVTYEHAYLIRY